jgi:hypothetical protein
VRLVALAFALFAFAGVGDTPSLPGPGVVRLTAETLKYGERIGGVNGHARQMQVALLFNKNVVPGAFGNAITLCHFLGRGGLFGDGSRYCEATYSLPHGRIQALGVVRDRGLYVLAVVGGTGLYSNVGGEVIVSTYALGPRQERLLFSLEAID